LLVNELLEIDVRLATAQYVSTFEGTELRGNNLEDTLANVLAADTGPR
jgi:hypothetical protein